jgi:hypothetical protein
VLLVASIFGLSAVDLFHISLLLFSWGLIAVGLMLRGVSGPRPSDMM